MAYTKQYFTEQPEDVKLNTLFKVIMGCIAIILVLLFTVLFVYFIDINKLILSILGISVVILKDNEICIKLNKSKTHIYNFTTLWLQVINTLEKKSYVYTDTVYEMNTNPCVFNDGIINSKQINTIQQNSVELTLTTSDGYSISMIEFQFKHNHKSIILFIFGLCFATIFSLLYTITSLGLIRYIFKYIIYNHKDPFVFSSFLKELFKSTLPGLFFLLLLLCTMLLRAYRLFNNYYLLPLVMIGAIILYSIIALRYTYRWMLLFALLFIPVVNIYFDYSGYKIDDLLYALIYGQFNITRYKSKII